MNRNSAFIMTGMVSIAAIICALILGNAVRYIKTAEQTISVKGLSERIVTANEVVWPLNFSAVGNDLAQVTKQVAYQHHTLSQFLTQHGIPSADITLIPVEIQDAKANIYNENQNASYRYVARAGVLLHSENVPAVRDLVKQLSNLVEKGIVLTGRYESQPQFHFTKLTQIKPDMLKEAATDAKAAAKKLALDAGVNVGSVKSARQGFFSISDVDRNLSHLKRVRVVTEVEYFLD